MRRAPNDIRRENVRSKIVSARIVFAGPGTRKLRAKLPVILSKWMRTLTKDDDERSECGGHCSMQKEKVIFGFCILVIT